MQNVLHNTKSRATSRRRGTTLIELVTACILITTALSVAYPMLTSVKREQMATIKRQAAMVEAENILQRISTMKWAALNDESLAKLEPSDWLQDRLKSPAITAKIIETNGDSNARQIEVRIDWNTTALKTAHVKFQTWVYKKMIDSDTQGQS